MGSTDVSRKMYGHYCFGSRGPYPYIWWLFGLLRIFSFYKALLLPRWKFMTIPEKYCPELCWEGNIETRSLRTLIEYTWYRANCCQVLQMNGDFLHTVSYLFKYNIYNCSSINACYKGIVVYWYSDYQPQKLCYKIRLIQNAKTSRRSYSESVSY